MSFERHLPEHLREYVSELRMTMDALKHAFAGIDRLSVSALRTKQQSFQAGSLEYHFLQEWITALATDDTETLEYLKTLPHELTGVFAALLLYADCRGSRAGLEREIQKLERVFNDAQDNSGLTDTQAKTRGIYRRSLLKELRRLRDEG